VVARIDGAAIIVRAVLDADGHQGRPYTLIVVVRVVGFATIDALIAAACRRGQPPRELPRQTSPLILASRISRC